MSTFRDSRGQARRQQTVQDRSLTTTSPILASDQGQSRISASSGFGALQFSCKAGVIGFHLLLDLQRIRPREANPGLGIDVAVIANSRQKIFAIQTQVAQCRPGYCLCRLLMRACIV